MKHIETATIDNNPTADLARFIAEKTHHNLFLKRKVYIKYIMQITITTNHKQETMLQIDLQKAFDELSDVEKAKFAENNNGEISELLFEQQEKPVFDEDGEDTWDIVRYLLGERGVSIEAILDLFADDYEYVQDVINDRCIESYIDSRYED